MPIAACSPRAWHARSHASTRSCCAHAAPHDPSSSCCASPCAATRVDRLGRLAMQRAGSGTRSRAWAAARAATHAAHGAYIAHVRQRRWFAIWQREYYSLCQIAIASPPAPHRSGRRHLPPQPGWRGREANGACCAPLARRHPAGPSERALRLCCWRTYNRRSFRFLFGLPRRDFLVGSPRLFCALAGRAAGRPPIVHVNTVLAL